MTEASMAPIAEAKSVANLGGRRRKRILQAAYDLSVAQSAHDCRFAEKIDRTIE